MHMLPPSLLTTQEKKPPNEGGKRSQTGGGVWDSHQPPSTAPQVGTKGHICAPLSSSRTPGDNDIPRCCPLPSIPPGVDKSSGGRQRLACRRPFPPPLAFSPRLSFPTIPTSCCFHSVAMWRWWRSMGGVVMWRRLGRRRGDVSSFGTSSGWCGIVDGRSWRVTWRYWGASSGASLGSSSGWHGVNKGRSLGVQAGSRGVVGVVVGVVVRVTWHRWARPGLAHTWAVAGALVGCGGSRAWWWWWWVVVVVKRKGGDGHNMWRGWCFNHGCSIWQLAGAY